MMRNPDMSNVCFHTNSLYSTFARLQSNNTSSFQHFDEDYCSHLLCHVHELKGQYHLNEENTS